MALIFKIKLRGSSKPPIWRKVKVNDGLSFDDFHLVIQAAFGWNNSHLYQFSPKGYGSYPNIQYQYEDVFEEHEPNDPETFPFGDYYEAEDVQLKGYFKTVGQKMTYIYDFGDDWEHIVELTDITDENILRPQCIGGKGKTPMDDCGGIWGYYNMVEAVNDPKHPEHEDYMEWLGLEKGEKWDEKEFNLEETNEFLQKP